MKHSEDYKFSQVPTASIQRSVFRRPHQYKTTFHAGKLIPFYLDEVLPGDTVKCRLSIFCRLFTMVVPVMENIYLDVHFFFVPIRLVWGNFQRFMGEQLNPGDSTSFLIPQMTVTPTVHSVFDYMGLPIGNSITVNALPFRCLNRIWNEWYRDQNLQNAVSMVTGDGPDAPGAYQINPRGKRHDYFTSCLPWPQKGPGVTLSLGSTAPVRGIGFSGTLAGAPGPVTAREGVTSSWPFGSGSNIVLRSSSASTTTNQAEVYADLAAAQGPTINSLRQAFQIQKLQEREARGGTRYVEWVKSVFGVESPDARLQRPEFLGGGTVPVVIQPVPQTGPLQDRTSGTTTPQGNLAAFGTAASSRLGFTKSFVEHGYILGLVSARTDLTYYQGINKLWKRSTKYDLFVPQLAHLGEQAVLNQEIYADGSANDTAVFGYQERWAEYKYHPSQITGLFRPNATGSIGYWHAAQSFSAVPLLNESFIRDPSYIDAQSPLNRFKAAPFTNPPTNTVASPDFLLDSYFDCQWARPMPLYSVPGMTDHF